MSLAHRLTLKAAGGPFAPEDPHANKILVVDDEQHIRQTLSMYLSRNGFETVEAGNGHEALDKLKAGGIFLVVTDISMPDMGGIELVGVIRDRHPGLDVVFITGHVDTKYAIEAVKYGAFDFLKKPFDYEEAVIVVKRAKERQELHHKALQLELLMERERARDQHLLECMAAFASFIDAKSPFTRQHSDRVARYSMRLCKRLGFDDARSRTIAFGGKIHDIGKIGIPDSILNKPGALSPEERAMIMKHPEIGEDCLKPLSMFQPFVCMVCGHHENFDGTGYPKAIPASETPVDAQIVKIADYFDAITSDRPYRKPMPILQAADFLLMQAGKALSPELTKIFVDDIRQREQRKNNRRLHAVMPPFPSPNEEPSVSPNERS